MNHEMTVSFVRKCKVFIYFEKPLQCTEVNFVPDFDEHRLCS